MDFALMYIPSEAVYYELVNIPDVMEFARKERVYPVSPNTLYAHLQLLLVSFQGRRWRKNPKKYLPFFVRYKKITKDRRSTLYTQQTRDECVQ